MLKITLVGNRQGKAAVSWPGLAVAAGLLGGVYGAACGATIYLVGGVPPAFTPVAAAAIVVLVGGPLGSGVRRSLRLPPAALPPIA